MHCRVDPPVGDREALLHCWKRNAAAAGEADAAASWYVQADLQSAEQILGKDTAPAYLLPQDPPYTAAAFLKAATHLTKQPAGYLCLPPPPPSWTPPACMQLPPTCFHNGALPT